MCQGITKATGTRSGIIIFTKEVIVNVTMSPWPLNIGVQGLLWRNYEQGNSRFNRWHTVQACFIGSDISANTQSSEGRHEKALESHQHTCNSLRYSSDKVTKKGEGACPYVNKLLPGVDSAAFGRSNCSWLRVIRITSCIELSPDPL